MGRMSETRRQKMAEKKAGEKAQKTNKKLQNPDAPVTVGMLNFSNEKMFRTMQQIVNNLVNEIHRIDQNCDIMIKALKTDKIIDEAKITAASIEYAKEKEEERIKQQKEAHDKQVDQMIEQKVKTDPEFAKKPTEEQRTIAETELKTMQDKIREERKVQMIMALIDNKKKADQEFAKLSKEDQISWANEEFETKFNPNRKPVETKIIQMPKKEETKS